MKVAVFGCGLIGKKRATALSPDDILVACCDTNHIALQKYSENFKCRPYNNYTELLKDSEFDIAVVAVVNKFAKDIIIKLLASKRHVIAEKPLGRNIEESKAIYSYAVNNSVKLKTGFNHRFHPAILKAKEIIDNKEIGDLLNIRARYGHGGRPGMEKEWRASKDLCGGGELLDQGVHIIDLIRWFGGEITEVFGKTETKFWEMNVEDNSFAILKTNANVTASFHVSWTNWKNIFSFEIFGSDGYLHINGLGGSYGKETLEFGKRKKEGGVPDIQYFEFPINDISWNNEWKEFKLSIKENREPIGNGYDGLKANEVITAIYNSNQQNRLIKID